MLLIKKLYKNINVIKNINIINNNSFYFNVIKKNNNNYNDKNINYTDVFEYLFKLYKFNKLYKLNF